MKTSVLIQSGILEFSISLRRQGRFMRWSLICWKFPGKARHRLPFLLNRTPRLFHIHPQGHGAPCLFLPVQSCRLNRNVWRWHDAQEQDKAMYISKTLQVAKRYGSGDKPEPADSKTQGEALALPLERVIGRKHVYVHAKPNDIAVHTANLKVRPT